MLRCDVAVARSAYASLVRRAGMRVMTTAAAVAPGTRIASSSSLTLSRRSAWLSPSSSSLLQWSTSVRKSNKSNSSTSSADVHATTTTTTSTPLAARVRLDELVYDKEATRYRGTLFGWPADTVIFYGKVCAGVVGVLLVCYVFVRGYVVLTRFSLQTVARLGFGVGFVSCMVLYTLALALVRRAGINANAVYNQSIAMVMRNATVQRLLGAHPRTGEFRAYSATGGFRLPLLRRVRSGTYTLADLLGTRPRRLQMLFVLKSSSSTHEGLVACDVRRERVGLFRSTEVYRSLSVTLCDGAARTRIETIILIGSPEDVVQSSLLW